MSDGEVFERLNAWGIARDGELVDLRSSLTNTQSVVGSAFTEARATIMTIVGDFRLEAETLRQHSLYEAHQGLGRLEHVVAEARLRFDAQDARHVQDLGELARRIAAAPAPTMVQPQAQTFRAATSPGGTVSFYPGGPVGGVELPPAAPTAGFTTPPRQTQPAATPAFDAWAAYRGSPPLDAWAAPAAAPQQSQQQPGGEPQRHSYMNTPGGDGGRPREMRLDARGWGSNQPKLDVGVAIDTFQVWKDRAMMFLSRERPDVRRLLTWAETQSKETLHDGLATQAAHLGIADLANVEYALHDGIKMTIMDSLLGRARICNERGCELWRSLCAEWSGAAPQLQMAKAKRFQYPASCRNMADLWSRLPQWERLGEEVELSGFMVPPWSKMVALDQLLPTQLADDFTSRASTGGHLRAGLGVVEITVALHAVFDAPRDKITWAVSHLCHPHNILTRRRDRIRTLRMTNGLSGLPQRSESPFDPFGAAHSSTSISAALGFAAARDLGGDPGDAIAVIGDGALSAGMAYEAMNNAGHLGKRLIVILNDNEMSIAPPVGAMSSYLSRLYAEGPFQDLKAVAKGAVSFLPPPFREGAKRAKDLVKHMTVGGTLFEELGFSYVGPIDGHDMEQLLSVLRTVKDRATGPILIHAITKKGKGFAPAEGAADRGHARGKFDIVTGE